MHKNIKNIPCRLQNNHELVNQIILYLTAGIQAGIRSYQNCYMRKIILLSLVLLTFMTTGLAQSKTITGKVTDATTGEPIAGVSIVSSKKKTTSTKSDGTYSIQVDATTKTLVFSHVSYSLQTVEITDQTTVDVKLTAATSTLQDVVVVGYGTQRKAHLTGAISQYKNEKMDEAPVARIDQALQGKIAGVQIQNISSEAGSDPRVRVRGLSSINAGANPLVVVDNVSVPDGMAFINPADVESVVVLKDAASAAMYGSRGASGVILITTKSGKADRPKYSFKISTGVKSAYETYPMMTMTEYGNQLFYEASLKQKDPSITPPTTNQIMAANERAAYVVEQTLMGGEPTDWQQEALRNAVVQNVQMNVSGGSRTYKYFLSGGYQKDEGLMHHSEFDKFNIRAKMDLQLSPRMKLNFNVNPSYTRRERPSVNFIDFVRFYSFLPVYHTAATAAFVNQTAAWANVRAGDFAQARHFNGRVYTGIMPDGSNWVTTSPSDPFSSSNNTPKSIMETRTIRTNDYRILSSADLTVNLIRGLDFKTMGSVYLLQTNALDFAKKNSSKDGDVSRGQYNNRNYLDLLSENTLTYNKKIREHSLDLLAGFTAQKTKVKDDQAVGLNYPSDNITTLNTALQLDQAGTFSARNTIGLLSYLGRVNYSYAGKYLLSASFRKDGSSYFATGHKWGSFPALSLGWVVSQEKFMEKADWLNSLKLRASYGVTGNNRIMDYAFIDLLYAANYPLGAGTGTINGGQAPSSTILSNEDITWERTFQFNSGIDITMLKSAVSLSIDVYQSKTDKLLLKQNAMAFTGVPQTWNNIGRLQNRGIELELTTYNIRKRNFRWSTSANIAHNKNKLLELAGEKFLLNEGERTENYRNMPGSELIEFYGYQTDGVWLSQKQIDDARAAGLFSNLSNLFTPGGLKLVDLDNNDTLDSRDRTVIGSPYPKFTWGITNTFSYGALDLSVMFQGSQGGQLINGDPNYNETKRINKNYNQNRWLSPMFPGDGKTPYSTNGFNWMLTDYVVEDASYYALREVIVGYTLPAKWAGSLHLNAARLYFSGQNLFFHKAESYRGINIEGRYSSGVYDTPLIDGYQRGSFPMPRTFLFGIDLTF
jgi:TonB-dependent starch-binding outer membrane protein SusC